MIMYSSSLPTGPRPIVCTRRHASHLSSGIWDVFSQNDLDLSPVDVIQRIHTKTSTALPNSLHTVHPPEAFTVSSHKDCISKMYINKLVLVTTPMLMTRKCFYFFRLIPLFSLIGQWFADLGLDMLLYTYPMVFTIQ